MDREDGHRCVEQKERVFELSELVVVVVVNVVVVVVVVFRVVTTTNFDVKALNE